MRRPNAFMLDDMGNSLLPRSLVALLAMACFAACAEDQSDPGGCVVGMSVACACVDGSQGAQLCNGERGFEPCVCQAAEGDASTDTVDAEPAPGDAEAPEPPPDFSACKRGLGAQLEVDADMAALSRGTRWWYNWGSTPGPLGERYHDYDIEFVPMVWGRWLDVEELVANIPEGARFLLGFNEPNYGTQANMMPQEAADLWPQLEEVAQRRGLELVSPAVNYCGNDCTVPDPFEWLDQFFAACEGCRVDYLAFHHYNCDINNLRHLLNLYSERYQRPLWITELACGWPGAENEEQQRDFMAEALAMLEADERVFRYAWFTDRWGADTHMSLLSETPGDRLPLGDDYMTHPTQPALCLPDPNDQGIP
jgi:hypothetical protein